MKITMKRINDLDGFQTEEFRMEPDYYGFDSEVPTEELLEEAKKLASSVDGICIAVVEDAFGTFVLEAYAGYRLMLFNAERASNRYTADLFAVTLNVGRGALTEFWYERYLRYSPGKVLEY